MGTVADVRTPVTSLQSRSVSRGPTSMGETRRLGEREPPSTQATSSSVSEVNLVRSSDRCPAAKSRRSRRDLSPVDSLSDPSRSAWRSRLTRRPVSYTHLRAHETVLDLVCRLLL